MGSGPVDAWRLVSAAVSALATAPSALADIASTLSQLVLPATCAGCAAAGVSPVCAGCAADLAAAVPHPTRPTPAPPGMPACHTLTGYEGVLRDLLLGYKERGRHDAAKPLGALLAAVVAAGVGKPGHLVLVPVPDTVAAARSRYGDHMQRLARLAGRRLRAAGSRVDVLPALRARPRPDSAGLTSAARAQAAQDAFRVRPQHALAVRRLAAAGAVVVLVDDVVTTGATLAVITARLSAHGVPVRCAAVLAATRRRLPPVSR